MIRISKSSLTNAINKDPQLALDLIESNSTKYQASIEQIQHSKKYNISWKICDLLLSFAEHYGIVLEKNKIIVKEKLSQQVISNMLGVNRILTQFNLADILLICYIVKKEAKTTATQLDNFYKAVTIASSGGYFLLSLKI